MNRTKIEWVKNPDGTQGYTWNPITGCLNNCPYCYARKLANGRLRDRYLANANVAEFSYRNYTRYKEAMANPFYPRFWESRIPKDVIVSLKRLENVKGKGIFACDMGELFGGWIPQQWQEEVFRVIRFNVWHRFYLLTKQPQNLIPLSPFPNNCWMGVSVTTNGDMTLALTNLANIKATVRYISFEPLLGNVGMNDHMSMKGIIDWVIIGAQTNPYKPPRIEWVEEIVGACDKAGIPVFLKDNLELLLLKYPHTDLLWEDLAHLRQEMPGK